MDHRGIDVHKKESQICTVAERFAAGRRVVPVTEDIVLRVRGRRYKVAGVAHERCQACGERIFGVEAGRRFDALAPVLTRDS